MIAGTDILCSLPLFIVLAGFILGLIIKAYMNWRGKRYPYRNANVILDKYLESLEKDRENKR